MAGDDRSLGALKGTYGVEPAFLQRAVFIAVLSFLFFLGTMVIYYIRQNVLYFLLSTAFLLVYVVTMFSWVGQRRSIVSVHENGISYKGKNYFWPDIAAVDAGPSLRLASGTTVSLPNTLQASDNLTA